MKTQFLSGTPSRAGATSADDIRAIQTVFAGDRGPKRLDARLLSVLAVEGDPTVKRSPRKGLKVSSSKRRKPHAIRRASSSSE